MTDLARLRKASGAALCLECGKCSTMCPLAPFGGFSAARMLSIQDPETEIHGHAEAVERCLTCASCEVRCPQGVRYTEFVRGLRGELPAAGRHPRPHGEVFRNAAGWLADHGDGRTPSWLDVDLRVAERGEIALFVGCLPLFDVVFGQQLEVEMVAIARAAVRLLNRLGIEPVVVANERCCGHDLLWSGEREAFERQAGYNAELFRSRGVEQVLTVCAECCRTWSMDYPPVVDDYRPRVDHVAGYLAPRLGEAELDWRATAATAVTYQDPCRLGRHLGVFDEPRQLLQVVPGTELLEMERSGRDALCCGTSGFVHCDAASRRLQMERLESAAATGASQLLTACPKCLIHFRCAQSEDRRRHRRTVDLEIRDLTEFVASRMADPSEQETARPSNTGESP